MKVIVFLFGIVLPLMEAGCIGGDGPRMEEIQLTEAQQRFKAKTTFKDGVVSVEVGRHDGSTTTLDSIRNYEDTSSLFLPRPAIPGFSSRVWLMSEDAYAGKTLLYTLVSWNEDDPTDYLAAGWWLHFPPGISFRDRNEADDGLFLDGPELDLSNPLQMPPGGEATYAGTVGGLYQYQFGSGWGPLQGEREDAEFEAFIQLTANFSDNTIQGCIGCIGDIDTQRLYLYPLLGWRRGPLDSPPTDFEVHLGPTPFNPDGTFENTDIRVTHPQRKITQSTGLWAGQFSNVPDADGNPRLVAGFSDAEFGETDGSGGRFVGIFATLTQAAVEPGESEGP